MDIKDLSEKDIIYNIEGKDLINIFGSNFVKNNKNICKMIIDNKEYKITEKYNVKSYNNNKLKIQIKGIDNVTDMSYMFNGCHHYYLYLAFQSGILIILKICAICLVNVHHYHLYLIFQNGILIMLLI